MKLHSPIIDVSPFFPYDSEKIKQELMENVPVSDWAPHQINSYHKNGNTALILVSTRGQINHLHLPPMLPTRNLRKLEYTKTLWQKYGLPYERARFMKIEPKGVMPEHMDVHHYWDDKVRLHLPIVTNEDVFFSCGGVTINMKEGHAYLIDNSQPHRVVNDSDRTRIHLVIDANIKDIKHCL